MELGRAACVALALCTAFTLGQALLEDIETCRRKPLPTGTREWKETTGEVLVTWGYDKICTSLHECLQIKIQPDPVMEPQLVPVEVQIGTVVSFISTKNTDVQMPFLPYRVSEEDFRNCNFSSGTRVIAEKTAEKFTVLQKFLQPGSNYFIAGTNDLLFKCEYGLRLNITVKLARCKYPRQTYNCYNHGRCVTTKVQPLYTCACCHGYTGEFCDDIDACANKPCQNGGQCTDVPNDSTGKKFWCSCPIGYAGTVCTELSTNPCDNHPCTNNGTCTVKNNQFTCDCLPGYTGTHCEVNINDCYPNPCLHDALCTDLVEGYNCVCQLGYYGRRCEYKHNECQTNPCRNGGVCIDGVNKWSCDCGPGYTGQVCEIKVDLCKNHECMNATNCIDIGNDYRCLCKPGFTGYRCEVNINECASFPCLNGGMCRDLIDSYKCTCQLHFTGENCHIKDIDMNALTDISHQHYSNLLLAVGTLGGALLIALMVLGGCYAKQYRMQQYQKFEYSKYSKQSDLNLVTTPQVDVRTAAEPHPSAEAIYQMSSASYTDQNMDAPLIDSLQSKRV